MSNRRSPCQVLLTERCPHPRGSDAGASDLSLVTLDLRRFIDDLGLATRSGLCIGTPANALARIGQRLDRPLT